MQNRALWGFSAEQLWQCIDLPDESRLTFLYHVTLLGDKALSAGVCDALGPTPDAIDAGTNYREEND